MKDRMSKVLHICNALAAGGAEIDLLTPRRYLKRLGVEKVVAYLKEGRGSHPLHSDFEEAGIPAFYLGGEGVDFVRPCLRLYYLLKLVRRKASLGRVLTEIQFGTVSISGSMPTDSNSIAPRTAPRVLLAGATRRGGGSENAFVEQIRKNYTDMRVTGVNISDTTAPDVVADLAVPWAFKTSSWNRRCSVELVE